MVYNVTKVYVLNNEVLYVDEGAISRDSANYNLIEVITNVSGWGVDIAFELPNGVFSDRLGMTQQVGSFVVPSDITELSSVAGEEWSKYQLLIPNAVLSAITATTSQTLGFSLRFSQTLNEGEDDEYTQAYTTEKDTLAVQGTIGGEPVALDPAEYQNSIVGDLNNLISLYNAINSAITDETTGLAQKVTKSGDVMTGVLEFTSSDATRIDMNNNDITTTGTINATTFNQDVDTDALQVLNLLQLFDVSIDGYTGTLLEKYTQAITDKFDEYQTVAGLNTDFYTKTQADNLLDDKVDKTTTIAGVDLQDNITLEELKSAIGNATTSLDGLLSSEDKEHLDTLVNLLGLTEDVDSIVNTINEIIEVFDSYPEGVDLANRLTQIENQLTPNAEENVQSDWNEIDTNSDAFIQNKPDVYTKTELDPEAPQGDNVLDLRYYTIDDLLTNGVLDARYYTETETDEFIQVAKQIQYYPNTKNDSGLLIPKGSVVQFAGSQGDFIKIKSAVPAEIASNPEALMGIAESDIANDAFGNVVWFGQVSNVVINPNDFVNGDVLYFDYNTGGLTKVAPTENKIIVAAVEKVSSTTDSENGILLVRVKWLSRNIEEIDGLQTQLDGYDNHVASTDNPHSVTPAQIGAIPTSEKAQANGVATLDGSGKIPIAQIPLQFDDVLQYNDVASFPAPGEDGKLYIDLSTNSLYRWDGTQYIAVIEVADIVNLADIPDVNDTGLNDNYILKYDSATSKWVVVDHTLGEINNVNVATAVNGEFLKYDGTNWINDSIPPIDNLNDVVDVNTTPTDQQVLYWNDTASEWQSKTLTKTDVGLNNVQNYGVASQVEAEAGIVDNKYMTPLRTKQAIDENISKIVFSIDQPIQELNDLTLREVFEGGNLVVNGDFSDGTTGWSLTSATGSVTNGVYSFTANAQFGRLSQTYTALIETKLYTISKFKSDSSNVGLNISNEQITYHSGSGNYEVHSLIYTNNSGLNTRGTQITDYRTSGWTQIEVDYAYAYNLTSLGLDNLTQEQMDFYYDLYQALAPTENPETTTHTQTESIKSLPVGTLNGQTTDLEVEGLTLENSVVNGDFSDGTTDWTAFESTLSVVSGRLRVTLITANYRYGYQDFNLTANDKIYLYGQGFVGTSSWKIALHDSLGTTISNSLTQTVDGFYNDIVTISTTGTYQLRLFADSTLDGGYAEFDNIMSINMTALGIEDYTEAQMLDLVRQGYFDGLTNVTNPSITSVGKNLFDKSQYDDEIYQNRNAISGSSDVPYVIFDNFKPNTQYTLKGWIRRDQTFSEGRLRFVYTDDTYTEVLTGVNATWVEKTLTSSIGKSIDRLELRTTSSTYTAWLDIDTFQLEANTTATAYEPYKSSTLALNTPLRSLPNGVRDRVYEQNGEVWLEKNIEEYVLQGSDITAGNLSGTNIDRWLFEITDRKQSLQNAFYESLHLVDGFVGKTFADSLDNVNTTYDNITNLIWLVVAKGTYADLAAAQAGLAGTVVQYQLATPEIINLTQQGLADGQISVYENGSIYNSSDTFHPDISFNIPINRSAQITHLIDNSDYQAKLLDSKASKVQEDWIEPTLLNGWVNFGSGYETAGYYKDEFDVVHVKGMIKNGTTTNFTDLFILPVGYRPLENKISVVNGAGVFATILVTISGDVEIYSNFSATYTTINFSFKVGE